jgi:hypothetical protein
LHKKGARAWARAPFVYAQRRLAPAADPVVMAEAADLLTVMVAVIAAMAPTKMDVDLGLGRTGTQQGQGEGGGNELFHGILLKMTTANGKCRGNNAQP